MCVGSGNRIVLVPDYICNVVHKAIKGAGLSYRPYRTDDQFGVDLVDLKQQAQKGGVCGILLASVFGAQNATREVVQKVREIAPGSVIILDECQNLGTGRSVHLAARCVGVFSFNSKNIRGAMGGGLFFKENVLHAEEPVLSKREATVQELIMVGVFLRQCITRSGWIWKCSRSRRSALFNRPRMEYSYCDRTLPYWVNVAPIAKISLVRALLDLLRIDRIERNRSETAGFYRELVQAHNLGVPVWTDKADTSPYLPLMIEGDGENVFGRLPIKGPYAREEDPSDSLRKNTFAIYNNGRGLSSYEKGRITHGCCS